MPIELILLNSFVSIQFNIKNNISFLALVVKIDKENDTIIVNCPMIDSETTIDYSYVTIFKSSISDFKINLHSFKE